MISENSALRLFSVTSVTVSDTAPSSTHISNHSVSSRSAAQYEDLMLLHKVKIKLKI